MSVEEHFMAIESDEFATHAHLASSLDVLLSTYLKDPWVRSLVRDSLREEAQFTVLLRVTELSDEATDERYQSPNDAAIAAYLYALARWSSPMLPAALAMITGSKRMWWAEQLAQRLLTDTGPTAQSGNSEGVEPLAASMKVTESRGFETTVHPTYGVPWRQLRQLRRFRLNEHRVQSAERWQVLFAGSAPSRTKTASSDAALV